MTDLERQETVDIPDGTRGHVKFKQLAVYPQTTGTQAGVSIATGRINPCSARVSRLSSFTSGAACTESLSNCFHVDSAGRRYYQPHYFQPHRYDSSHHVRSLECSVGSCTGSLPVPCASGSLRTDGTFFEYRLELDTHRARSHGSGTQRCGSDSDSHCPTNRSGLATAPSRPDSRGNHGHGGDISKTNCAICIRKWDFMMILVMLPGSIVVLGNNMDRSGLVATKSHHAATGCHGHARRDPDCILSPLRTRQLKALSIQVIRICHSSLFIIRYHSLPASTGSTDS